MFVSTIPQTALLDRLDESFADRFAAMQKRGFRIAYYYHQPDTSTFRYRVQNMVDVVNAYDPEMSAGWFWKEDQRYLSMIVDSADVIVLCRACYNHVIEEIIQRARRGKKPIIFDVDDLVFDVAYVDMIIDTLDEPYREDQVWNKWFAYVGRLARTLQLCDRAIVTNARLGAVLQASCGKPCSIVPNFLNAAQMQISSAILNEKQNSHYGYKGPIYIGYFSGSPSHTKDFACVVDAIRTLLKHDDRLMLRTVGYLEPERWMSDFKDRLEHHDFQDYVNLQRLIGSTEVNLIPLQDNIFTNCKSELKYFEAAIVGTVSVASPTYVYSSVIEDGVDGLLSNGHAWENRIRAALDSLDTPAYGIMANQAAEKAENLYGWHRQLDTIRAALLSPTGTAGS